MFNSIPKETSSHQATTIEKSSIEPVELSLWFRILFHFGRFFRLLDNSKNSSIDDKSTYILGLALRKQGVQITDKVLRLWQHARSENNAKGLLRIKYLLAQWGIKSQFMKIPSAETQVLKHALPDSILCLNNGQMAYCIDASDTGVKVGTYENKIQSIAMSELSKIWSGVIIKLDVSHTIKLNNYTNERIKEIWNKVQLPLWGTAVLFIFTALMIIFISSLDDQQPFVFTVLALNLCGLATTFTLLKFYLFGQQALPKFCQANELQIQSSCGKVLESENSKFLGIPHADIGFIWFTANLGLLFLSGINSPVLAISTLFGIAYSLFSIYYQAFIIQSWCKLCLVVQAIVVLQGTILMSTQELNSNVKSLYYPDLLLLAKESLVLVSVAFIWSIMRYAIVQRNANKQLERLYSRHTLDTNQYVTQLKSSREITIKPLKGALNLTPCLSQTTKTALIISAHCHQCAIVFREFLTLHESGGWPIDITIILRDKCPENTDGIIEQDGDYKSRKVTRRITAMVIAGERQQAINALSSWYNEYALIDYDGWLSEQRFFDEQELHNAGLVMNDIDTWATEEKIKVSPIVTMNGKIVPELYLGLEATMVRRTLISQAN